MGPATEPVVMTIQLPKKLYVDLRSLSNDDQVDVVDIIAELVATARARHLWLQDFEALRKQIRKDGGLSMVSRLQSG